MEQSKRLFLNSVINVSRRPVAILIGVLLTPFILSHIGKADFGVWTLTGSLLSYAALLKLGLNAAVDLHVPKLMHRGDSAGMSRVVSSIFAFYTVGALVAAAVVALVVWKFPDWFSVEPALRQTSRWVVALVGGGIVTTLPLTVFFGVMAGIQRYDLIVGPNVLYQVLRAGTVVLLFKLGMGLIALTVVTVAADVAATLTVAFLARRRCPEIEIRFRHMSWALLPGLIAYSGSNVMYSSGQLLMMHSGKAVTGLLFDPETVTEFAIPLMALMMVGQLVMRSVIVLKPAVSLMEAKDESAKIRQAFLLSTKYGFMVGVPACIVFLLNGPAILGAWVGDEMVGAGGAILAILCVPQMLRQAHMGGYAVLSGLGKHRVFGSVVLAQGIVSIVLGWVLVRYTGLGLIGVAVGYAIPEAIASGLIVPLHCCRTLGIGLWREVRDCLVPALVGALPFAGYCALARAWYPTMSRLELLVIFGLGALPLAAGMWFLALRRDERRRFLGMLSSPRRSTGTAA